MYAPGEMVGRQMFLPPWLLHWRISAGQKIQLQRMSPQV